MPGAGRFQRYVVWADGQKIRSWWTVTPEVETFDSIESSLAGPTGISHGAAVNIPGLLMTELRWGAGLRMIRAIALKEDAQIDGARCNVLEVRGPTDERPTTLWIDAESYLIRRIVEEREIEEHKLHVKTTHDLKPQVGMEIASDQFKFDPATAEKGQVNPPDENAPEKPR